MNTDALALFSTILALITSPDHKRTFKEFMAVLLERNGDAKASHVDGKHRSSVSRFLNDYDWNTRAIIRTVRQQLFDKLRAYYSKRPGRRPVLYAAVDLTTLEKCGKFPSLPMHVLNGKYGLHIVVLYLVIGEVRFPYGFRVWRGKGTASPSELALKLLRSLPLWLKHSFTIRVLGDSAFGNKDFLNAVYALGMEALTGMRWDRVVELEAAEAAEAEEDDEQPTKHLYDCHNGERVRLKGMEMDVWVAKYVLNKPDGTKEVRYAVATFEATGKYLVRLGRKRWLIEMNQAQCTYTSSALYLRAA